MTLDEPIDGVGRVNEALFVKGEGIQRGQSETFSTLR
jgi:hypothetical protein